MKKNISIELRHEILKALKCGNIEYSLSERLLEFSQGLDSGSFDYSVLSTETKREIIEHTKQKTTCVPIDRELKLILLDILSCGIVDSRELKIYSKYKLPLFREIDYSKLSNRALEEIVSYEC